MTLHELVRKLFQNVPLTPCDFYVNCPFCIETVGKKDYKSRFGINTSTGVGNCHRCEKKHSAKGGKAYWFRELCRVFRVNYVIDAGERDAYDSDEASQSRTNNNGSTTDKRDKQDSPVRLPTEYEPLWKNVDEPIARAARKYLRDRGVTARQIRRHRIGFCAVGKYAYRIIVPVYSSKGKLKAFVARDFSGKNELRYLNSEGSKTLFNVPQKKKQHGLLAEGIFDVLAFEHCQSSLLVDPIAGLGKSLTKSGLRTLSKYEYLTIYPDPDRPGVEGAIKRANALQKRKVRVYVVVPLDEDVECGTDLGSLTPMEIDSRFGHRVPFTKSVAALMRIRVAANSSPKPKRKFAKKQTSIARVS